MCRAAIPRVTNILSHSSGTPGPSGSRGRPQGFSGQALGHWPQASISLQPQQTKMQRNWPNWCQRPKPAAHTPVHSAGSAGHGAHPGQQPPALGQLTEALHWAPSTTSETTPRAISRAPLCCSWRGWPRGPPGQMEDSRSLTSQGGPLVPEDPGAVSSALAGPSPVRRSL